MHPTRSLEELDRIPMSDRETKFIYIHVYVCRAGGRMLRGERFRRGFGDQTLLASVQERPRLQGHRGLVGKHSKCTSILSSSNAPYLYPKPWDDPLK